MGRSLKLVSKIMLFLLFFCLLTDIANLSIKKQILKDSLDISTKYAALELDENPLKIGNGIFEIEPTRSKATFLQLMSLNTNTNIDVIENCMIDYRAINSPQNYLNIGDGKTYKIEKPTFIALMKFRYKGLLIKEDIIMSNNFAGSILEKK